MLLRMSVTNCLSIAETQEISLVATKLKGAEEGLIPIPNAAGLKALPVAMIYGPNAAGKSNVLLAFSFLRWVVLSSHRMGSTEGGGIPRHSFALDPEISEQPTTIDVDFIVDDIRYSYGIKCDDTKFLEEWLYSFPEGKKRRLFERNESKVEFGGSLKGAKRALVDFMRPNSSFIATATQNDHEEFSRIVSFFRNAAYSRNIAVNGGLLNNTFKKNQIDPRTIEFLKKIGTGVVNCKQTEVSVPESMQLMGRELIDLLKKHVGEIAEPPEDERIDRATDVLIELAHMGANGEEYPFDLERESSGTRRLLLIMSSVFRALDAGSLIILDEIDASLHTQIVELIVEIFSSRLVNKNGAQLIATTHDTNILSCNTLRRDQVWFCEKDDRGATSIYSLSDIKLRDKDNYELGYLQGRYGAIPFSGDIKKLFGAGAT